MSEQPPAPSRCLFCRMRTGIQLFRVPLCGICHDQAQDFLWVSLVLVALLLIGSVTGAQFGTQIAQKFKPEYLRLVLAAIVLRGAARMALRREEPLMPVARLSQRNRKSGYYKRFRQDGSVVPWQLDRVNDQRREDGLDPISYELADD